MRQIVLSVDYEIFGNGTGDVRQHVTAPAESMARSCEQHGMPLTVFFELEEYLAFERYSHELKGALGYDPSALVRDQIRAFVKRGHDIQLHLHPQWVDARYQNGDWVLRKDKETVDDLFECQEDVTAFVGRRKAALEEVSDRPVRVYRAGAFSAQPGAKLLRALTVNGIVIDSSVVKGLYQNKAQATLDYRDAPCAKGPWKVQSDVAREDPAGTIWEFPIYSVMGRRVHQATWDRLRAKFSSNVPKRQQKEMVRQLRMGRNPLELLRFLFQPVPIKLDFHNVSPRRLYKWIKAAPPPREGLPDVVVLIGHTKEHISNKPFDQLLKLIKSDPGLKVASFDQVAEMVPAH